MQLRRTSVLALAEIAKHGPNTAQAVIDASAVPLIVPLTTHIDARLKRQVRTSLTAPESFRFFLIFLSKCVKNLEMVEIIIAYKHKSDGMLS